MGAKNSGNLGLVNIQDLIDDASCYRKVRELHWPEGVECPFCDSEQTSKHGFDQTQEHSPEAPL